MRNTTRKTRRKMVTPALLSAFGMTGLREMLARALLVILRRSPVRLDQPTTQNQSWNMAISTKRVRDHSAIHIHPEEGSQIEGRQRRNTVRIAYRGNRKYRYGRLRD